MREAGSQSIKVSGLPAARGALLRQRIGPQLDMHGARLRALAALHQPRRAIAARAPEPAALPARVGVVDAPVEALGKEAQGVGDAHHDHLAVLQRHESVVEVGGGNRNVLAQAQRVVLVDPGVVARLRAGVFEALEARARIPVIGETFLAVITSRIRPVERALALAAVETDQRAVRARTP